jgi:PQQ-like domain
MNREVPAARRILSAPARALLGMLVAAAVAASLAGCGSTRSCNAGPGCGLVLLDAQTGAVKRTFSSTRSPADVVSDGRGGWFVAGAQLGPAWPALAHLRSDGSLDKTWHAELPRGSQVRRLDHAGDRLYLALLAPPNALRLAAITAASGKLVWVSRRLTSSSAGTIALAAAPGAVYVAGAIDPRGPNRYLAIADPRAADGVLAFDPHHGGLLRWRGPQLLPGGVVEALAVSGPRLYLGGTFSWIDEAQRPLGLAAVSVRDGSLLSWAPSERPGFGALQDIQSLAVVGDTVLVAGRRGFAAFDTGSGNATPWSATLLPEANVFAVSGSTVFVGGAFPGFGVLFAHESVPSTNRNNLAAIDLATGRFTDWMPNVANFVSVTSMAVSGTSVLVAGDFGARR